MANSSSLIVLVGKTEFSEYSPKKIVLWGKIDKSNEGVLCSSFPFINKIEFVKLIKKYLIVNEGTYTHVYNSKTMKNLATLNFGFLKNYCLSLTSLDNTNSYFVYSTYEDLGCVYVYNLTTFSYNNEFQAHKSHIQALQLNYLNNMIATCSEKGTLIRIFSIPDGLKLFTLKRGVNSSIIYSMNFGIKQPNQLIVYSSSGTIHIFKLELNEISSNENKGYFKNVIAGIYNNIANSLISDQYQDLVDYKRSDLSINNELFKSYGLLCEDYNNINENQQGILVINLKGEVFKLSVINKQNNESVAMEMSFSINNIKLIEK